MTNEIDPIIPVESISNFDRIMLDVRDTEAFTQQRVAGAVRVPIEIWESAAKNSATSLANAPFGGCQRSCRLDTSSRLA